MNSYFIKKATSFNEISDSAKIKGNYPLLEKNYAVKGIFDGQYAIKFYKNKEELLADIMRIKEKFGSVINICFFNHIPHTKTCTTAGIENALKEVEAEARRFETEFSGLLR